LRAVGFITYGADGRIMAIVVDSGRKKPGEMLRRDRMQKRYFAA